MATDSSRAPGSFPEGEASTNYVQGRQRAASWWAIAFMASTMIGIIALTALLYNVVNSAFGYVMVQNEIDPDTIVLEVQKAALLDASNLTASEDDEDWPQEWLARPMWSVFLVLPMSRSTAIRCVQCPWMGFPPRA